MWPLMARRSSGGPGRGPPGGSPPPGDRHPGHGRPYAGYPPEHSPPGNGSRSPYGPGWMDNDDDLWKPTCVKVDYIMG
jgi:hypothetical protein